MFDYQNLNSAQKQATIASSNAVDAKIEEFIDINTRDYLSFLDEKI